MLTVKQLRRRKEGQSDKWISNGAVRGSGALWVRLSVSGVGFYFGYAHAGQKRKLPLGGYDEHGVRGISLEQARDRAGELSRLYQSGITDLHGHLERQRQEAERARVAEEEAARRTAEEAKRGTLRQLLTAYVDHLHRAGKVSANEVRGIFDRHIAESDEAQSIIDRRAADLATDDFVAVIGAVVNAGKGRQAGKLRSYLRAAYQLAMDSKTDPDLIALRNFGITANPIASIGALSKYNRKRKRTLAAPELTAFLKRLDAVKEAPQREALKLCLYLGGQRPTQLLRAEVSDVDLAACTITLYDGKGRRTEARRHELPLVKEAAAILATRIEEIGDRTNVPVFSTDEKTRMRLETLSTVVHDMSEAMVAAKEAREPFRLSDLRRTAETMLASLKVSRDVRAQLQSHGLGGVQQQHYDMHDYTLEKQQTLKKWASHLASLKAGKQATVVPIGKGRASSRESRP